MYNERNRNMYEYDEKYKNLYAGNLFYLGPIEDFIFALAGADVKGKMRPNINGCYSMILYSPATTFYRCKLHWSSTKGTIWFTGNADVIKEYKMRLLDSEEIGKKTKVIDL